METGIDAPAMDTLKAILIDPQDCTVEEIMVAPERVPELLRTERTSVVELDGEHCLVMDDCESANEHAARFRFSDPPGNRPFFGPVLVLGMVQGNWTSASIAPEDLRQRILWEHWDNAVQNYAAPAPLSGAGRAPRHRGRRIEPR